MFQKNCYVHSLDYGWVGGCGTDVKLEEVDGKLVFVGSHCLCFSGKKNLYPPTES
jgi:hypothetical protein